jgi:hypothetical protein
VCIGGKGILDAGFKQLSQRVGEAGEAGLQLFTEIFARLAKIYKKKATLINLKEVKPRVSANLSKQVSEWEMC